MVPPYGDPPRKHPTLSMMSGYYLGQDGDGVRGKYIASLLVRFGDFIAHGLMHRILKEPKTTLRYTLNSSISKQLFSFLDVGLCNIIC